MVLEINGSYKVLYHPVEGDTDHVFEVDWSPPFKRVSMITELEKKLNVTFPPASQFNTPGQCMVISVLNVLYQISVLLTVLHCIKL